MRKGTEEPDSKKIENDGRFLPGQTAKLPESMPRTPKVRQAGHFVDQKLRYRYPVNGQPSGFDLIDPDVVGKVQEYGIKCEGIRLSVSEERLLNALYSLLKDKSENKDAKSDSFYKGNYETTEVVPFGQENVKRPHIHITRAELYKAYTGNDDYSGREIKDINKTLTSLAEKPFLITYDRKRFVQEGKNVVRKTDRIQMVKRLFEIVTYTPNLSDEDIAKINQGKVQGKEELIIAFNPIFIDQIDSKYVEYPKDIDQKTVLAAGGHPNNVTQAIISLRDFMMRELSANRHICQINAERLPHLLKLDKYIAQGRKKLINDTISKAIETCKNLGLILDVVITDGAEGQKKYVFTLNPGFE